MHLKEARGDRRLVDGIGRTSQRRIPVLLHPRPQVEIRSECNDRGGLFEARREQHRQRAAAAVPNEDEPGRRPAFKHAPQRRFHAVDCAQRIALMGPGERRAWRLDRESEIARPPQIDRRRRIRCHQRKNAEAGSRRLLSHAVAPGPGRAVVVDVHVQLGATALSPIDDMSIVKAADHAALETDRRGS